jgi:hypothetical protein
MAVAAQAYRFGPPWRGGWRLSTLLALAIFIFTAATSLWLWLGAWTNPPAWRVNPLALSRQAQQALVRSLDTPSLAEAERVTRQELAFGPARPAAWLRLAYIHRVRAGRLDETAIEALRSSYEVAPHDPEVYLWRTRFVFEHWSAMPADLRRAALDEVGRFYSVYYRHHAAIERLAYDLREPNGRLALRLAIQGWEAQRRAAGLPVYPLFPLRLRPPEPPAAAAPQPSSKDQSTVTAGTWRE